MLNRRILRVKAFKTVYSIVENPEMNLNEALRQLKISSEATRTLYLFLLGMIRPLANVAKEKLDERKNLFNATAEDLNPNYRFCENALATLLEGDRSFEQEYKLRKFPSWEKYDLFLRHLYNSFSQKDYYKAYLAKPTCTLKDDCALFAQIFDEEFDENSELWDILESVNLDTKKDDEALFWNDDIYYVVNYAIKDLKQIAKDGAWSYPELYISSGSETMEDDSAFAEKLVTKAYAKKDEIMSLIMKFVPETRFKDKLNSVDSCLIVTALSECMAFDNIPVRVTVDEYLEISKYYGGAESTSFINGVLRSILTYLIENNQLNKTF